MITYDVLDVHVSAVNLETVLPMLRTMVASRRKGYVCVAPVSTIVEARRDPAYRAVVNAATIVTPDGMPLVWLGHLWGLKDVHRVYGPDLMLRVCNEGRMERLRHFFYGATKDVCDKLEHNLKAKFPGLVVVGKLAPPYMERAQVLAADAVKMINTAKPDVLWVGLGSPKQDFWMSVNRASLDVPVMIGIGAAFDFHAGVKFQAPRWMRSSGLEWLFRLLTEPHRLWKRYLVGNFQFIYWVARKALLGR